MYFSFAVINCSDEILRDISIIKFPKIYLLKFAAVSETEHNSSNLLKLQVVIIDFSESRVVDMSAIEALNVITERYNKVNKKVYLTGLSNECKRLINRAEKIVDITVLD